MHSPDSELLDAAIRPSEGWEVKYCAIGDCVVGGCLEADARQTFGKFIKGERYCRSGFSYTVEQCL